MLQINDLSHSVLSPTSFRVEYKRGVGTTVFQRNVRFHVDINLATPGALCNQENIKVNCSAGTNFNDQTQLTQTGSVMKAVNAINNATTTDAENSTRRGDATNKNSLNVNSQENNNANCSSSSSSETENNLINNFNNSINSNNAQSTNNSLAANKKPLLYVLTFTLVSGPVRRFKRICDHLQVQISGRTRPTANVHTTNSSTQSSNSNLSNNGSGESSNGNLSLATSVLNANNLNNHHHHPQQQLNQHSSTQPSSMNSSSATNSNQLNASNLNSINAINNCTAQLTNNLTAKSPKQQMHSKNRDLSDSSCGSCVSENHSSLNNQSSEENMTVNLIANSNLISVRTTTTNSSATTSNLIANKNCGIALARCKSENPQQGLLFSNVSPILDFDKDRLQNQTNSTSTPNAQQKSSNALNGKQQPNNTTATAATIPPPTGLRLLPNGRKLSLDYKLTSQ